ncbi:MULTISPECIES: hypothetical protein [unclassified Amycolatopsis]|uniref:hypothetical protein n=1 Tax=unclassified Amycolatopsis TaxID=2618356 RepID=UPI002E241CCE|nr:MULTISPECIES: hypothetical protein [unclassified Amycolatopsis]
MPTQIPLWVTLVLAIIAIMGPIGGALIGGMITARRDDRRWERELEREEARWQRETEREEARREREIKREDHRYWLELRATTYTEVIVHWRKFTYVGHGIVAVLKLAAKKGVQPEMKERYSALKEAEGELRDALAKSELYSTLKMHIMSIDARTSASNFRRSVSETDTALIKSQDASDNLAETIANLDKCNKEQVEFARAIKNELETPNGTY